VCAAIGADLVRTKAHEIESVVGNSYSRPVFLGMCFSLWCKCDELLSAGTHKDPIISSAIMKSIVAGSRILTNHLVLEIVVSMRRTKETVQIGSEGVMFVKSQFTAATKLMLPVAISHRLRT